MLSTVNSGTFYGPKHIILQSVDSGLGSRADMPVLEDVVLSLAAFSFQSDAQLDSRHGRLVSRIDIGSLARFFVE